MSKHIVPTLTAAGLTAALSADTNGVKIQIQYLALGDGGGAGYVPNRNDNALRNERFRTLINASDRTGPTTVTVQAHVADSPAFWVREVGFVLDDGTFLAIWSDDAVPLLYKTADGDVVLAFSLDIQGLPDDSVDVVVAGPNVNVIFDQEFRSIITTQANLLNQQFQLAEAFRAEFGYYPGAQK